MKEKSQNNQFSVGTSPAPRELPVTENLHNTPPHSIFRIDSNSGVTFYRKIAEKGKNCKFSVGPPPDPGKLPVTKNLQNMPPHSIFHVDSIFEFSFYKKWRKSCQIINFQSDHHRPRQISGRKKSPKYAPCIDFSRRFEFRNYILQKNCEKVKKFVILNRTTAGHWLPAIFRSQKIPKICLLARFFA